MLLRSSVGVSPTMTIYLSATVRVVSFGKMCLDYNWFDEPRVSPDLAASEVPIGPRAQMKEAHVYSDPLWMPLAL